VNTKDQILEVALDLFSVRGYEATSISQIADAVGLRKASLYSHFANKQDILDTLVEELTREFDQHSIFATADWDDPEFTKGKKGRPVEAIIGEIKGQIRYIIHDPKISKIRKMLTIEQFQNEELKKIQSKHNYEDVLKYNLGQIRFLIREGILKDLDPEIMAAQLAWPISMWTNLCDREPEREAEAMELLDRHVRQFFRVYGK
ncbi:MAG: TetR/AcrR family transcriptional regulator, partial [Eubacteriales bacterium]|nr:TetR/AcrR family transcriptional regulator [Eubacteriales bacterium]